MAGESEAPPPGQLVIYEDGATRLQVRIEGRTVWLSQRLIAELYQVSVPTVNEHLAGIYGDGELTSEATIRSFRIVQREGKRDVSRAIEHYSLDAILAVGYRVRSHRGTVFRQWATARLGELLIKGFTLDDERLKEGRTLGADYFDELLERIRDIRASERRFYQKITDIYATSVDYDPAQPISQTFFATVQNKLHWAIHGRTAAEVIADRADASRPNMGLTTWKNAPGGPIRRADVTVAKNYLSEEGIRELNRVVTMYLDFAEDQARRRRPMHMAEWVVRLDAFLQFNERDVLTHAGRISHQLAEQHAYAEFEKHVVEQRRLEAEHPTSDFDQVVEEAKRLKTGTGAAKAMAKKAAKEKPARGRKPKGRGA
ncbi:MAG: virulence RhuM family protein [Gemmatimonadales bacterium]|nr:virulence RhuM family protein [Gemmatimonadales bacterium]